MAFRRGLSARGSLVARRYHPSFSYLVNHAEDRRDSSFEGQDKLRPFLQQRSFLNSSAGFGAAFQERSCSVSLFMPSSGSSFCRYMSTSVGQTADKIELMGNVADVLADPTVQAVASQASVVNEVAIAAADSFFPIMCLQHVIGYVHQLSGLNWWASIALTTLLIRTMVVPFAINQMRASAKLAIIRPRMEEIKDEMQSKGASDPMAAVEGNRKMQQLFKETGVSPLTPLKGMLIQGPVFICFFLAVSNMVEKVPSFKTGGAYWFTDLTTPDSFYILPILTGLSFLITVECNMMEGMEANPSSRTIKNVARGMAFVTVPFTMNFAQAIFCYWIASNIFSLGFNLVLKKPGLKEFLGIPKVPVQPQTANNKPAFDVFSVLKKALPKSTEEPSSVPAPTSKLAERKSASSYSSSGVLSQRLRSLEKDVKGRKKNKKR